MNWRGHIFLSCLAGAGLLLGALGAAGQTGIVRTRDARLEGDVTMNPATVRVGTNTVPWDAVLYVLFDPAVRTLPLPHRVRCLNGEEWVGEITALSTGKLTFRFDLFGPREVPSANLAFLDFSSEIPPQAPKAAGTLYLRDGDPLPGTLLWIDPQQLALESPLGVLTVSRERVLRYVFPAGARASRGVSRSDEVRLVDGTILQGSLQVGTNQITLRHPAIGELRIPTAAVRSITKSPPDVLFLANLSPELAKSGGLFGTTGGQSRLLIQRHDHPSAIRQGFLTTLQIPAQTTQVYRLGEAAASGGVFHAWLGPVLGARGTAKVALMAGTNSLWEREVKAGETLAQVSVPIPIARELAIKVEFAERIGFPSGVCLADAFLLTKPEKGRN